MRVPLSWLRDFVDVELTPEQLAERLTLLGMEVKHVERWGADWQGVVTGELLTVEKHPRADRLSLTTVTLGDGSEPLAIVCGATNIAPGQRIPVALPGSVLPGDRRIARTEKMGVVSNGMLCSGDELKLTADADGILVLPAGTPLGVPLADLFGDVVLDVDVKPNRGDALSILGLAREVSAVTGAPVRMPEITVEEGSGPSSAQRLAVRIDDPDLCTGFAGRWVSGVTIGPSPDAIQMRLLAAGQRPISNVVDASNYVMLELGKPIHTFDAAAIHAGADGRPTIIVRRADGRGAPRDAGPRAARPRGRHAADRGSGGSPGHRRGHGRRHVRGVGDDPRRGHRVGDLRPGQHPADRPAVRPALRGLEPLREGPGAAPGTAGRGSHGAADQRLGGRRDRGRRRGHRSRGAAGGAGRVPSGVAPTACWGRS